MNRSAFIRGLLDDPRDPQLPQYDPQGGWNTARFAGQRLAALTGPGGVADAFGLLGEPSVAEQARSGDYLGAGLTAAGVIPGVGALKAMAMAPKAAAGAKKMTAAAKAVGSPAVAKAVEGFDPAELATRYPERSPAQMMTDAKTGKEYLGKVQSPEAEAVMKVRAKAQKDINAGRFEPFFDPNARFHVDPANYPLVGNTLIDAAPKKEATMQQWLEKYNNPEVAARLDATIERAKGDRGAYDWYAMGQLEKAYIDELGEQAGRAAFQRDFANGMAATTGGMDPTSNYLMTTYANFMGENGQALPAQAYDLHAPIGGRYASGNLAQYDKMINQGAGLTTANPKRFNFSSNFQGHLNRPTVDEQGMEIIHPKAEGGKGLPQWYAPAEMAFHDAAARHGISPVTAQELSWFGQKGVPGKPMIQIVNEAIERTRRVTGQTPDDIVRNNIVRKRGPVYSMAPVGLLGAGAYGYGQGDVNQQPGL